MKKLLLALLTSVLLVACSSKIEGDYADQTGSTIAFKSDGTVQIRGTEFKYEVVGKELKLDLPQGRVVFNIIDEDTLSNEFWGTLKKKKK